jgi:uncharacterized protein involved in exopolysaccharide biosynthesis
MIQEERSRPAARVGVLQAIRRYPMVVIVPMVLFCALGIGVGIARPPTYTATSQLTVGQLNIADPAAVGTVVQASQQLAAVYARAINANFVRQRIAKDAGSDAADAKVSATPIPDSPLIKVTATSSSSSRAVKVANAGARALTAYAVRSSQSGTATQLATEFRAVALAYARQRDTVARLQRAYRSSPTRDNKTRMNDAQADLQALLLKREGLRTSYQGTLTTTRSSPALQPFAVASGATSDRSSKTQILALLGLVAGAAIGAALANARLNRRVARLTRP